jgi:hypothetical protein
MKQTLFFSIFSILVFSCGNGQDKQKSDSLAEDSVLRSLTSSAPPPAPAVVNPEDTVKIAGLPPLMEGDIVFQNLEDKQSIAFGKATHSKYNNVGIVFMRNHNQSYIVVSVKDSIHITPINTWINQGKDHHVVIFRLKNSNAILNAKKSDDMKKFAKSLTGRKEDLYFSQTNDELYSSELVWKMYKNGAKIDLSTPEKLGDLDLSAEPVKSQMKQKYPSGIPKENEVITPEDLYNSPKLEKIYER